MAVSPARTEQQGVAIGRSFGHGACANHAAATGFVVDDDVLFQRRAQLLREQAGNGVHTATGREGHHDGDGFVGIVLCCAQGAGQSGGGGQQGDGAAFQCQSKHGCS